MAQLSIAGLLGFLYMIKGPAFLLICLMPEYEVILTFRTHPHVILDMERFEKHVEDDSFLVIEAGERMLTSLTGSCGWSCHDWPPEVPALR